MAHDADISEGDWTTIFATAKSVGGQIGAADVHAMHDHGEA
jgi:hypothetical protein